VTIETLRDRARSNARSTWVDHAARIGFAAKGVVNAIIGVFALKLALGHGGAFLDSEQATRVVAIQPFGTALLVALGAGLACHSLWLFLQASLDLEGKRGDGEATHAIKRVGWATSGIIHGVLAATAIQAAIGGSQRGGNTWVQALLNWDGGRWVMMIIGAIIVGVGVQQLVQAYTAGFQKDLDTARMSGTERRWAIRAGRFGLAARGVVLPIVGWFFVPAGLRARASEVRGTGAALREIASQSWGTALVAIVAAGFVAYAVHMMVNARYRRACA
jgi:hypothetical protein